MLLAFRGLLALICPQPSATLRCQLPWVAKAMTSPSHIFVSPLPLVSPAASCIPIPHPLFPSKPR